MTEPELNTRLQTITPPDEAARAAAHAHWAALAKPLGGLGSLETMLEDAAALTGTPELDFARRAVLVLCADNGVVAQGVSQTDASVTRAVLQNLAARRTSVCQMAAAAHCSVVPVDMGIAGAPVPGVQDCRIAPGTKDFTCGPAMTRAQAVQAIGCGIALVRGQKQQGVQLLATGEMGIGNTTTSSAVASVLLGAPVQSMTGRGAGLSDAGLARKIDAIRRGIARNQPNPADPLDVLAKLGGFDIAGLCGVFLGGALEGVPILMDGFISSVAALCAVRLCPAAAKAVFASHVSAEPAAHMVLDALGKAPLITAECAARVAKHRAMRAQKQFATVECPQNLHLVRLPQQGTALLEDLGNLAANELYRSDGSCLPPKQAAEKMLAGIEAIAAQCNHLIIVSNEVFSGGADYAGETDLYLQALAMVNNAVAAKADAVCRVVCGLPVYYKGGKRP